MSNEEPFKRTVDPHSSGQRKISAHSAGFPATYVLPARNQRTTMNSMRTHARFGSILCYLVCLFSVGCGRMLDGKIYSLDDGVVMPMQIETSYGYGKMNASNPKTGERLEGTYSGVSAGQRVQMFGSVGSTPVSAVGESDSTLANAIATLIGDKGTVLDCVMQIKKGMQPHGMGSARDRQGREYRIQF